MRGINLKQGGSCKARTANLIFRVSRLCVLLMLTCRTLDEGGYHRTFRPSECVPDVAPYQNKGIETAQSEHVLVDQIHKLKRRMLKEKIC